MFFFRTPCRDAACPDDEAAFATVQKTRKDLIGELEAIIEYDDHLHGSNVYAADATWEDIRNEELVHVGELLGLLVYLAPYQKQYIESGMQEFEKRIQKEE